MPTHDLSAFQRAVSSDPESVMTTTAMTDATSMGFRPEQITAIILAINSRCFYKSTPAHNDHKKWHDVYHVPYEVYNIASGMENFGDLYVKFTLEETGFILTSFKEK